MVGMVILGRYQSGQMGQTVNLLVFTFGGSNPSLPTLFQYINWFYLRPMSVGKKKNGQQ